MLVEVKVKVARKIGGRVRRSTDTFLILKEFFSEAEYAIMQMLSQEQAEGTVENFEILSLKMSSIREIITQYRDDEKPLFVVTLKDVWLGEDGSEKYLRYKVLLWADNLAEANRRANDLARQGYEMLIEGIKQVDYIYLDNLTVATNESSEEDTSL